MATQAAAAKKQQDLQVQYTTYKNTLQQLAQNIGDVEQESEEHNVLTGIGNEGSRQRPLRLVLDTLAPLPGDRKCFRMINGVLVERTVKDVMPALQTNADGLKKVLDDLVKQYKSKQNELEEWKTRNKVQVVQS